VEAGVASRDRHHGAEGPWELPQGWCWAALDQVVESVQTTDPRKYLSEQPFHYIDLGAIQQGVIVDPQTIVGGAAPSRARQLVRPGDTLFSCVRVYLRNIAVVPDGLESPIASTAFCVLRPSVAINADYLHYFVQSRRFIEWMMPLQRGNSPPAVLDVDVKAQLVPLPPYREQLRIAARIDQLFAEIAEGERALLEARKDLEKFRRALLKAAVTGELMKDWPGANTVQESGHDLLERIAKSRSGKTPSKARGRRAAGAPPLDTVALPSVPESWAWTTVRGVADVLGGLTKNPNREKLAGRSKYLRVANVQAGSLDLSEMKEIGVTTEDRQRAALRPGDLLIVEGNGSLDQIGRCALWNDEIADCVHQNHIIKVRFEEPHMPRWCLNWFLSPHGRGEIEKVAASTSGLHTLSISKIEGLPVPIPPPLEAAEINRRVSDGLAAADDTLALLDAEATDAARLKQSILKAAFEGHLVPQHPEDEPASALLARLPVGTMSTMRKARGRPRKGQ
jgi:type I restriction enzyme S subunit